MKSEDYPQTEFVARLVPTAARSNAKPPEVVNPAVRTNPELARRIHHGETRWHLPGPCGVRVRRCCCRLLSPLFLLLRPSPSGASTPRTLPSLSLSLSSSLSPIHRLVTALFKRSGRRHSDARYTIYTRSSTEHETKSTSRSFQNRRSYQ